MAGVKNIMWCARGPSGELMMNTVSPTRGEVFHALFDLQDEWFQRKYWKRWEPSLKAYRKMGYKVVKVVVVTLSEWRKLA
jgi:hypothetical protein